MDNITLKNVPTCWVFVLAALLLKTNIPDV